VRSFASEKYEDSNKGGQRVNLWLQPDIHMQLLAYAPPPSACKRYASSLRDTLRMPEAGLLVASLMLHCRDASPSVTPGDVWSHL
jgi:hypothetical protein